MLSENIKTQETRQDETLKVAESFIRDCHKNPVQEISESEISTGKINDSRDIPQNSVSEVERWQNISQFHGMGKSNLHENSNEKSMESKIKSMMARHNPQELKELYQRGNISKLKSMFDGEGSASTPDRSIPLNSSEDSIENRIKTMPNYSPPKLKELYQRGDISTMKSMFPGMEGASFTDRSSTLKSMSLNTSEDSMKNKIKAMMSKHNPEELKELFQRGDISSLKSMLAGKDSASTPDKSSSLNSMTLISSEDSMENKFKTISNHNLQELKELYQKRDICKLKSMSDDRATSFDKLSAMDGSNPLMSPEYAKYSSLMSSPKQPQLHTSSHKFNLPSKYHDKMGDIVANHFREDSALRNNDSFRQKFISQVPCESNLESYSIPTLNQFKTSFPSSPNYLYLDSSQPTKECSPLPQSNFWNYESTVRNQMSDYHNLQKLHSASTSLRDISARRVSDSDDSTSQYSTPRHISENMKPQQTTHQIPHSQSYQDNHRLRYGRPLMLNTKEHSDFLSQNKDFSKQPGFYSPTTEHVTTTTTTTTTTTSLHPTTPSEPPHISAAIFDGNCSTTKSSFSRIQELESRSSDLTNFIESKEDGSDDLSGTSYSWTP